MTNEELNEALKGLNQEIHGKARFIELDDTIKFNCKRCGSCCTGRSDIIMNPYDIYKIAIGLNITTKDVVENYCEVHPGCNSGLPIVTLREDERGLCPFLKFFVTEGKFGCSINNHKPGACIMHPIGVVRSINKTTGEHETKYIEVPSCGTHGTNVEVKVRDFIKPYLDNEECHEAGSMLLHSPLKYVDASKFVKCIVYREEDEMKKYFSEEQIERINSVDERITKASFITYMATLTTALYDLDTNIDFMSQVDEVEKRVKKECFKMISVFRVLGIDLTSEDFTEDEDNMNIIKETIEELEQGFKDFCEKNNLDLEEESESND